MKIAFFTDTYHPQVSGVVENVETSAKALRELGHHVTIVAPRTPKFKSKERDVIWIPSVKVIKNPEVRLIVPIPDKTMRALLAKRFDIIHGHAGGTACFLGWELARRKKIPYIFTYHTLFNRYTHYLFNGKIITPKMAEVGSRVFGNLCSHVIAPTERVKKELLSYGVSKPITVISGGVNLTKYQKLNPNLLRKKYKIARNKKILLYVGRLGKEKNIQFLLRSFARLKRDDVVLFVVGDGPERIKLEKLVSTMHLNDKIIFTGFVAAQTIPSVYASGDLFVFASKSETQGLVVVEAMAAGTPVLAVKDEAYEGVVVNNVNGVLVRDDPGAFTQALNRLLDDKEQRESLGKNAKTFVRETFSSRHQAELLTDVYQQAVDERLTTTNGLIKQRLTDLRDFFKVNQRFNQFKEIMRFVNGKAK